VNVEQLFEEHHDALYRYLVRLTGDADLAADLAQEAFVRLVQRPPREMNLRAWLFAVATNLVRDDARSRSRWRTLLRRGADRLPVPDPVRAPDSVAEGRERERIVRRGLEALSWKERTILLMREEGFTHREIAVAVGTTTGAIGTMAARALHKLSAELGVRMESLA